MGERRIVKGWIVERGADGRIVPIAPAGQPQMPSDPTYDYKGPKAAADLSGTQVNTQGQMIENRVKAATAQAIIAKAEADAQAAQAGAQKAQREAALPVSMTDDQRKAAAQRATLDSIIGQINRTEELYQRGHANENPDNLFGLLDIFPTPENKQYDAAARAMAEQGQSAFRVPGVGSQSDYEAKEFAAANRPNTSEWDTTSEEKMRAVRNRVASNRAALGMPRGLFTGPLTVPAANSALAEGYRSLTQQMQDKPLAIRQAMLRAFDANKNIQALKAKARFGIGGQRAGADDETAALLRKYGVE